jgi:hypothetical protein
MYYLINPAVDLNRTSYEKHASAYVQVFEQCANEYSVTGIADLGFVSAPKVEQTEAIPQSFVNALADFDAGRVLPAETALNERPPGV